jgi:hypothetical protein
VFHLCTPLGVEAGTFCGPRVPEGGYIDEPSIPGAKWPGFDVLTEQLGLLSM